MSGKLRDRVALVIGAGSIGPGWGNGKASAVAFAREGAKVAAVDLRQEAAEETAAIIRGEGNECLAIAADATRSDEVKAAVDRTMEAHGRIDILHNNVGDPVGGGPVELAEDAWDRAMDVNVKSVFLACKHVLPVMEAQSSGVVINTSSLAGLRWSRYNNVSYYAGKAGVNQFTQAIALQYAARGIRANAILPGFMDTPLIYTKAKERAYADQQAMVRERSERVPMKRMGTGWDVARAAVFLASDDSEYITGVLLPVDGGMSCSSV